MQKTYLTIHIPAFWQHLI